MGGGDSGDSGSGKAAGKRKRKARPGTGRARGAAVYATLRLDEVAVCIRRAVTRPWRPGLLAARRTG